jgi:crooked neck
MDQPEAVWKSYIDFETRIGEADKARNLYEILMERSKHVKVWISYARFEADLKDEDASQIQTQNPVDKSRAVFEKANQYFREHAKDQKEERLLLLENWLSVEEAHETTHIDEVKKKFPKRVKKRRKVKVG